MATVGAAVALGAGLFALLGATAAGAGAVGFSDFFTLLVCAVEAAARAFEAGAETVFALASGLVAAGLDSTSLTVTGFAAPGLALSTLVAGAFAATVFAVTVLAVTVLTLAGLAAADLALAGFATADWAVEGLATVALAEVATPEVALAAVGLAAVGLAVVGLDDEGVALSELVFDFAPSRAWLRDDLLVEGILGHSLLSSRFGDGTGGRSPSGERIGDLGSNRTRSIVSWAHQALWEAAPHKRRQAPEEPEQA